MPQKRAYLWYRSHAPAPAHSVCMFYLTAVYDLIHIIAVDLGHKRAFKPAINICTSVIIHEHARIYEPSVTADFIRHRVFILGNELKRTFRPVAHSDASARIDNICIEIISAIFLYNIRRKKLIILIRPIGVSRMIPVRNRVKNITVAHPVVQIINRCAPALKHMVTEAV